MPNRPAIDAASVTTIILALLVFVITVPAFAADPTGHAREEEERAKMRPICQNAALRDKVVRDIARGGEYERATAK